MGISIDGIKITHISIQHKEDDGGKLEVQGSYALMGSNGVALAKQSFNGYNDMKVVMSPITKKAFDAFMEAMRAELNAQLGLS